MNAPLVPTVRGFVLATVLVAPLAGCGSASTGGGFHPKGSPVTGSAASGDKPSSSSTAVAPSAMTSKQLATSALDAYKAYMAAYEKAYEANDPSGLGQYAIDPLLSNVTRDIQKNQAKGEIWRFHNVLNPQLQGHTTDNMTVLVLDCVQTLGSYMYSASTGKQLRAENGATGYYQATLKYTDGGWKVADAKVGNKC